LIIEKIDRFNIGLGILNANLGESEKTLALIPFYKLLTLEWSE